MYRYIGEFYLLFFVSTASTFNPWMVTHPSANRGPSCLISVFLRELVFPTWYCRSLIWTYLILQVIQTTVYCMQCCGAGAGTSWSEPVWRCEGKNIFFYYFLAYFYMKRSRSRWKKVPGAGVGQKRTGSATLTVCYLARLEIDGRREISYRRCETGDDIRHWDGDGSLKSYHENLASLI